jgi:hypothetical protein
LWGASVETFEDALDQVAHRFDGIDSQWRARALAAGWPANLSYPCKQGLRAWRTSNAQAFTDATWLAVVRRFYEAADFRTQPYHEARRTMRRTADFWGWMSWIGFGFDRYVRPAIAEHRADIVALAWLEIELAKKIDTPVAVPGSVTAWARLGERFPVLCERITPLPPSAPRLPPAPTVTVAVDRNFGPNGGSIMRVVNLGPAAVFRANLLVRSATVRSDAAGGRHDLWWERAQDRASRIATNGEDHFRFGHINWEGGDAFSLSLYAFDYRTKMPASFWNVGHLVGQTNAPIAELEITVTSDPEMPGGPLVKRISFGPVGLTEAS